MCDFHRRTSSKTKANELTVNRARYDKSAEMLPSSTKTNFSQQTLASQHDAQRRIFRPPCMSGDDKSWLAFFVRPNTSPAVHYPTPESVAANDAAYKAAADLQAAHWNSLSPAQQEQQNQDAIAFIAGLVPSLIEAILSARDYNVWQPCIPRRLVSDCISPDQSIARIDLPTHTLMQLAVHKQVNNGSCGYYAIHNGLALADLASSDDHHQDAGHLSSPIAFWRSYHRLQRFLLSQSESHTKYPWGRRHVESGVMEREYMRCVLDEFPALRVAYAQPHVNIVSVPECFTVFRGAGMHHSVVQIDRHLDLLRQGTATVFCLGLVAHWVVLYCNNIGGKYEFILADSLGHKVIEVTDEEIWAVVLTSAERKRRIKGRAMAEYEMLLYFQQMTDIRDCVAAIVSHTVSGTSLESTWVSSGFRRMLRNFAAASISTPEQLSAWLDNEYHPKRLEELFTERIAVTPFDELDSGLKADLGSWLRAIRDMTAQAAFAEAAARGLPYLSRLSEAVGTIAPLTE